MRKILVIEDNYGIRKQICQILKYEGFTVIEAANGVGGLEIANRELPDLIICDILMPEMDGHELLSRLKENLEAFEIPFIFLTASAAKEDMRKGMDLGADDYITKPFTPEEVVRAVNTRLEKYEFTRKQTEKKVSNLSSNISYALPHEFMTPLTIISGSAEILQDTITDENALGLINNIADSTQRLERLIRNFLVYTQAETLNNDPDKLSFIQSMTTPDSEQVITETADRLAERWKRTGDLSIQVEASEIQILAENLAMITEELLDNAFKFSAPGSTVRISGKKVKDKYLIQIENTGSGMTPEQITNIGAYMQFERKTNEQQGSGLGLAIVKRLTEIHNGTFSIASGINGLTTIEVELNQVRL